MKARVKKISLFLLADIIIIAVTMIFSFLLRFDGDIPARYEQYLYFYIILGAIFTVPLLFWRKLYSFTWSFVSLHEIIELLNVVLISGLLFYGVYSLTSRTPPFLGFPRSIIIIYYSLLFLFLSALRSAKRVMLIVANRASTQGTLKRTLIIGANSSAEELIRILKGKGKENMYHIVGILEEDREKHTTFLHGIKVLGDVARLPEIAKKYTVETLIVALPEASRKTIKKTISLANEAEIKDIKILPNLYEMVNGTLTSQDLREIRAEDLLGRKVAHIETEEIKRFMNGKKILITGAAGSIGSELCRQIRAFAPSDLYLLDYEESNLFDLMRSLESAQNPPSLHPVIADVRNAKKIYPLLEKIKPHIVFHAAAYKHVPLMEEFPEEAVMTNVFGTFSMAKAAVSAGVEKFILISSDKAVNPISVMGRTKKLAEMIMRALDETSATKFISVRFGNVLGSRGSVLPIFQDQIKRRISLTVTHPRMARYFMTTPEACLLVLEAAASGKGGEIFVLDMGKPIKINELAKELIKLSGLKPDKDIPIVYTRPRTGEKLFENIFSDKENMLATRYQKIFKTKSSYHIEKDVLLDEIERLKQYTEDTPQLIAMLTKLTTNH